MALMFRKLHPHFVAEVSAIDLRRIRDRETLDAIRAGMDEYAVLVFRRSAVHGRGATRVRAAPRRRVCTRRPGRPRIGKSRLGTEALADISNLDENGEILKSDDRRRMYALGNRLWHTDASFQDPPGRYSMLSAQGRPAGVRRHGVRRHAGGLRRARRRDQGEARRAAGAPLDRLLAANARVRVLRRRSRRSSKAPSIRSCARTRAPHAGRSISRRTPPGSSTGRCPEGRLFLRDLIEHATQPEFVYRHLWRAGDLVIWDNRATMHRARAFDDAKYRRELRRVTTLDIESPAA